jgi:DeoR family transcriptional regulator, fructose operon transcriptional repressor
MGPARRPSLGLANGLAAMIGCERLHEIAMFAQERQQRIIELLKERSRLSVPELVGELGASPATIRRDLTFLEDFGKILRTHGGVLSPGRSDVEASFDRKSRQELGAKMAIAEVAAAMVADGDSVFVDSGSTAFRAGVKLLGRARITIFTNSVPLLSQARSPGCRLVALGGEVRSVSLAMVGGELLGWVHRIKLDLAFIGTSGIDPEKGPATTELSEASVKGAAVRNARRAVLLADASKWERAAPVRFADWADLSDIVSDHRPSREEQAIFGQNRIRFHLVRK